MSEVRAINPSICRIESEEKSLKKVRASSAEKAAHLLDTALSARSANSQGRDSHFVFTLHLFQHRLVHFFISRILQNKLLCSLNSSSPATPSLLGGRSRLHLIDFGSCERTKTLGGSITQVWNTHPVLRELTSAHRRGWGMSSWGCLMASGTSLSRRAGSPNSCERCLAP